MKKDKYQRLLESIRRKISEEGMVANPPGGSGGFSGSSDPKGPTAGHDPLMKAKPEKRKKDYLNRYISQLKKQYLKKK